MAGELSRGSRGPSALAAPAPARTEATARHRNMPARLVRDRAIRREPRRRQTILSGMLVSGSVRESPGVRGENPKQAEGNVYVGLEGNHSTPIHPNAPQSYCAAPPDFEPLGECAHPRLEKRTRRGAEVLLPMGKVASIIRAAFHGSVPCSRRLSAAGLFSLIPARSEQPFSSAACGNSSRHGRPRTDSNR